LSHQAPDRFGDQKARETPGIAYGVGAYLIWGLFPLFWPLVRSAGAAEILAHRVIWSLVVASVLLALTARRGWWNRLRTRRNLILLATAAAVIAVNWGIYIWAVNHGHVVEAALGYYINPILSILFGVGLLRERLAGMQWVSVGLAAVAVVVLTLEYGTPPWIALALAISFATYGLIKNRLGAGAVETLTVESAMLAPLAIGYLIFLETTGGLTFVHLGWAHSLFLVAAGPITAVPLLLFAAAATRIPLSTLGLLQYLTPTGQFLLGVLYFGETMSAGRWVGFALVWLALMILTWYGIGQARRHRTTRELVLEQV
jgi:chloramphenicol-sensitive protein RarD